MNSGCWQRSSIRSIPIRKLQKDKSQVLSGQLTSDLLRIWGFGKFPDFKVIVCPAVWHNIFEKFVLTKPSQTSITKNHKMLQILHRKFNDKFRKFQNTRQSLNVFEISSIYGDSVRILRNYSPSRKMKILFIEIFAWKFIVAEIRQFYTDWRDQVLIVFYRFWDTTYDTSSKRDWPKTNILIVHFNPYEYYKMDLQKISYHSYDL